MADPTFDELLTEFGLDFWKAGEAEDIAKEFAYEGLDPAHIARLIMDAPLATESKKKDISLLVIIGLTRGNNVMKIRNSIKKDKVALFDKLVTNYRVVSKAGTSRRDAVTFSRCSAVFSWVACEAIVNVRGPVTYVEMNEASPNYPPNMMTSAFGSLIPGAMTVTSEVRVQIFKAFCLFQIHLSRKINKNFPDDIDEQKAEVERYVNAAADNAFVPHTKRAEFNKKFSILTTDNKATPEVIAAATAYDNLGQYIPHPSA